MSKRTFIKGNLQDCKHPAGKFMPIVDAERCEGAGPCAQVCPADVFALRKITADEKAALSWKARVKVWVHGGQQAFAVNVEACSGCGLCVTACPERAITLARNKRLTQEQNL